MAGITRPRQTTPSHHSETLPERRVRRTGTSRLRSGASLTDRKDGSRKLKAHSYTPPPVMARGVMQDMAVLPRSRPQPRHRYDFALSIPGAEVRLPSMPAVRVGWRAASGILVILMCLSLYILLNTPAFQIDVLEVEGLQRLTLEDINSALSISGESIAKVDPESLYVELQAAFPELSSIKVKVYLPARVKLEVVERVPVIDWMQDGEEKWIDLEGFAFPPRGEAGNLIRVEADGYIGAEDLSKPAASQGAKLTPVVHSPMLPPSMISTLQSIGAYVPAGTPILFSAEHGFGWQDPNGWRVYFGKNLVDINQKLLIYQKLQESLVNQGIEPSLISVEFLHAPFYRTER